MVVAATVAVGAATGVGATTGAGTVTGAAASLPTVSSLITNEPCLTLSPLLMNTSLTVPACVDGTSIVALSVSKVIKPSSSSMTSPTLTSTSITSTSPSSPISGTEISMIADAVAAAATTGAASTTVAVVAATGASTTGASSAGAEAPADFISAMTSPSLILSPTLTNKLTSSPANGAGISIEALSVSTVIIPSSASRLSPTAKQISIISTSSPPTSGTRIFSISDIFMFLL